MSLISLPSPMSNTRPRELASSSLKRSVAILATSSAIFSTRRCSNSRWSGGSRSGPIAGNHVIAGRLRGRHFAFEELRVRDDALVVEHERHRPPVGDLVTDDERRAAVVCPHDAESLREAVSEVVPALVRAAAREQRLVEDRDE